MEQLKNFMKNKKKIVIPVAIFIVILLAVGCDYARSGSDDKKDSTPQAEEQITEQEVTIEEEESNETINDNTTNETKEKTVTNEQKNTQTKNSNTTNKTNVNNKDNNNNSSQSSGSTQSQSKPSHTHTWVDHTATKQVWVSKMVEVPVYDKKQVQVAARYIFAHDGYTTTNVNDAKAHAKELILAGLPSNYRTEPIYETKSVQTGTKQEDQGYYETQSYVDYTYCSSCNQRK